jgi:hypothetical protein
MEFDNDTDAEPSEFEVRLKRLKEKHGEDLKEFKLKVWAKMLVLPIFPYYSYNFCEIVTITVS